MPPNPLSILKQYFGYPVFRPGQAEIIDAVLAKRDVMAVMPTGAGKSLCFQIPALIFGGITLVVSPLISLMRDQVAALTQNGAAAAFINSSLTQAQTDKALERARQGFYKIIYVAPERLDAPSFVNFAKNADISLAAVDEAHCVSQWGQDFRPSYLNIAAFIASLPKRPVVAAFTATATSDVKDDVVRLLGLKDPLCMTMGFDRANLYFEVRRPRDKYGELAGYLGENEGKSGIVYCATRKTVDEVTQRLIKDGFSACSYHAGLTQAERGLAQDDFVFDRKSVIVATNAFGMGIDKSDVAFVVHYNMPKNMESYYQEAGRAGRDGSPAECVLFYSAQDVVINKFLIEHTDAGNPLSRDELREAKARDYRRLAQMERYCKTTECLRRYILDYFGDDEDVACGNCGNCRAERPMADVTADAQKILSCVYRMNRGYGITTVIGVLRGEKSEKLAKSGLDSIKSYGVMADKSAAAIRATADFLIQSGYLLSEGDKYPVVKVTEKSNAVLFGGERVFMPVLAEDLEDNEREAKHPRQRKAEGPRTAVNADLLAELKELRLKIAREEGVPAFVVFSDATLVDMCARIPSNEDEFLGVSGVGQVKLAKYGAVFLEILRGKQTQPPNESKKAEAPQIAVGRAFNADLLAELKELRLKIAREEGVPVFVVFSDSTLVDMCARLPADEDEFLSVSGVGQVKLAKYGAAFLEILRGKQAQPPNNGKKAEAQPIAVNRAFNADLLAELKELRLKIAREEGVPAFVVFSDSTLVDMCARMPSNEDEFLSVSGVGQVKLAKYGAAFLEAMREFSNKQRAYENAAADPAKPADYAGTAPYDLARFVEENYEFSGDPVSVSVFMDKINALVYQKRGKGLAVRKVTGRLIEDGYLEDKETDGIKARVATGKGKLAGISTVLEENAGGAAYYRNYYNAAAQRIMLGYAADSLRAEGEKR